MICRDFTYTDQHGEQDGVLAYDDGLMGPIVISPDPESCYTFCSGYTQGGSNAVFLQQELDALVGYRVVERGESPEGLLSRFISEWVPDRGDLRDRVRALLADYLG